MKVVIHNPVYCQFAGELRQMLATPWEVTACANDVAWLTEQIVDADAAIALELPGSARAAATKLRMFHFPGAGAHHILEDQLPRGCALCNVYEHEIPIAEYVIAAMLMQSTRIADHSASFRQGAWDGGSRTGTNQTHGELAGRTLGIIGYGHIGSRVARIAQTLGMRIVAIRRNPQAPLLRGAVEPDAVYDHTGLGPLLQASDFVLLACPLTDETRGMLGADELAQLKPNATLINVARAEVIDEQPLFDRLQQEPSVSAVLDVWYQYPDSLDKIFHGSQLPFHELANCIVTPHSSGHTDGTLKRRLQKMAENLDHLARGEPLERILWMGTSDPSR